MNLEKKWVYLSHVHIPWIGPNFNTQQFSKLFLNNYLDILSSSNTIHCFNEPCISSI